MTTSKNFTRAGLTRRSFLSLMGVGAIAAPLALAGCGASQGATAATTAAASADAASTTDLGGAALTFVGDDAFAPFRSMQPQSDGSQKLVGLDIDVMDEMAKRLNFTYTFEAQDFAATLASVQNSNTSFTMPMSSNDERKQTFDFTRGYYQPLVGALSKGGEPLQTLDALKGKKLTCTSGTVQNKFITAALPDNELTTFDGGDQCLQEVLAGRVDVYICDGAEGLAMQQANPETVLGLLPANDTDQYVSVYRIMAKKGATFIPAFNACVGEMISDGTMDELIAKWTNESFTWGDKAAEAATAE
ncbi:transporter substrate-binding domain-containing protein [uncultured Parolsenella sp.]|uniref:substrate-binding periplasmic protein n=1 Tax=uncultured Parolsenella sp. TaxID=2083008 RepID=UPI0027D9A31B|nr:transporter substrate-binding domain-containing protein [uncultured Parolsenella sp.]